MPDLHERIEATRQKIGAALLELRLNDERRQRIVSRAERAYAELMDIVAGSDDPQVVVD